MWTRKICLKSGKHRGVKKRALWDLYKKLDLLNVMSVKKCFKIKVLLFDNYGCKKEKFDQREAYAKRNT